MNIREEKLKQLEKLEEKRREFCDSIDREMAAVERELKELNNELVGSFYKNEWGSLFYVMNCMHGEFNVFIVTSNYKEDACFSTETYWLEDFDDLTEITADEAKEIFCKICSNIYTAIFEKEGKDANDKL